MSTLRANIITDTAGGNTTIINGTYIRPGSIDPENRIINGAFDFWQRGTSFGSPGLYGADRWLYAGTGGNISHSRQSFPVGDTFGFNSPAFFLRMVVSGQSTASQYAFARQSIEGVRSYAGQTITVLGWARRSSGSGNMAVEMSQNFGSGGSPSAEVTEIGAATVTLTDSWQPFAVVVNVPSIAGKTFGTLQNDRLNLHFWTSAGSDFNSRSNSLGLQTINIDLWGIHIKLGTHIVDAVSLYKQPELVTEFVRCQRYYEIGGASTGSSTGNSGGWYGTAQFKVTKRAAPTMSVNTNITGTITNFLNGTVNSATTVHTTGPGGTAYSLWVADAEF